MLAVLVIVLAGVPVSSLVWKLGLGGNPQHWSVPWPTDHLSLVLHSCAGDWWPESLALAGLAGSRDRRCWPCLTCWLAVGTRWFHAAILLLIAAAWALPGPVVGLGLKGAIKFLLPAERGGILERVLYLGPSPVPALWAYLLRFFPCAVVVLWPVVRLLPRELREAARVDGAGPLQELWHVVVPLTAAGPAAGRPGGGGAGAGRTERRQAGGNAGLADVRPRGLHADALRRHQRPGGVLPGCLLAAR